MIDKLWTDVKEAPARIRARRDTLVTRARHQAFMVRTGGQERIWTLHTTALTEVEDLLLRTTEVPVLSRVTTPVERLVSERLEATLAVPLAEYDGMNAKTASRAVRDLDHLGLIRVRRYEQDHKGRKTVLDAVEAQLEKRACLPELAA
jgi:hypothetical protein